MNTKRNPTRRWLTRLTAVSLGMVVAVFLCTRVAMAETGNPYSITETLKLPFLSLKIGSHFEAALKHLEKARLDTARNEVLAVKEALGNVIRLVNDGGAETLVTADHLLGLADESLKGNDIEGARSALHAFRSSFEKKSTEEDWSNVLERKNARFPMKKFWQKIAGWRNHGHGHS
jgi:hypothetical protein